MARKNKIVYKEAPKYGTYVDSKGRKHYRSPFTKAAQKIRSNNQKKFFFGW